MKTTKSKVQKVISESFPFNMTYQKGQALRVGKGKKRKRIPRLVGASEDRLFSVILYGRPEKVTKVEFMNPFYNKKMLARNMVAIQRAINHWYPDWDAEWLRGAVATIEDEERKRQGPVELYRLDVYSQGVLFVTVT